MNSIQVCEIVVKTKSFCLFKRNEETKEYSVKYWDEMLDWDEAEIEFQARMPENKSKKGYTLLDGFTANAIMTVYNAAKPEIQEKMKNLGILTLSNLAFKFVK